MKSDVLQKRFADTALSDVLRAVDGGSLVGAVTLSLCVIDYLSYLHPKGSGNRSSFEKTVGDYLQPIDTRYLPGSIYALRCALVHTYRESDAMKKAGINGYLLKHRDQAFHLSGASGLLQLNVDTFIADVIWATDSYFSLLKGNSAVEKRADSLLVVSYSDASALTRKYESMHRALKTFDESAPNLADLRHAVTSCFPT